MSHDLARMGRTNVTHYSNKNWSDLFHCDHCGREQRFNLNYLGSRRAPHCDGEKVSIERVAPGPTYWAAGRKPGLTGKPVTKA